MCGNLPHGRLTIVATGDHLDRNNYEMLRDKSTALAITLEGAKKALQYVATRTMLVCL